MQIVIDIPEVFYEALRNTDRIISGQQSGKTLTSVIFDAVANGTPLPKGHGRLIDISDIEWARHREERNYIDYDVVDWDDIENAPTIIEADSEVEK